MSRKTRKRRIGDQSERVGIFASAKANRALIVVGILTLITLGWGAIANRRSATILSSSTATMPPAVAERTSLPFIPWTQATHVIRERLKQDAAILTTPTVLR